MRTRTIITMAAGAIALTLMLPTPSTQAMTLPAPAGIATQDAGLVTQVRTVCRTYWHRGRMLRRCWWVGPPRHYNYRPYRHHRRHWRW